MGAVCRRGRSKQPGNRWSGPDLPAAGRGDFASTGRWDTVTLAGMTTDQRAALVVRDPQVCHGQATVRGTRIMVSVILDSLADGMTEAEIVAEYPTLTAEGIRAAAAYGAELARDEYPAVTAS